MSTIFSCLFGETSNFKLCVFTILYYIDAKTVSCHDSNFETKRLEKPDPTLEPPYDTSSEDDGEEDVDVSNHLPSAIASIATAK